MKKYYLIATLLLSFTFIIVSCSDTDDEERYVPVSPVIVDLTQVPYPKLSDYHFFEGDIKNQVPSLNVIPYEPASSLFTDYASKKRFIWMPANVKATYDGDGKILVFPVGTVLIKSFYYTTMQPGNTTKIIETRLMIRKEAGWRFFEYVWNDTQTDANLVNAADFESASFQTITFKKPNNEIVTTDYRIPSESECITCHKSSDVHIPIGLKPQNLNFNYNYSDGSKNQLQKLVDQGYLTSFPSSIVSIIDYKDVSKPLDIRMRSYLDINCAHCHSPGGKCGYRNTLNLQFSQTTNNSNIGVCIDAGETVDPLQKIVLPGNFSQSIMHYRLSTNDETYRMPEAGRTIVHDEGVALLEQWITSLTQPCN